MSKIKKKRSKLTAYNNWGYAFVAPFVIVFLVFSVYPVLVAVGNVIAVAVPLLVLLV